MKKGFVFLIMTFAVVLKSPAQIYGGDYAVQLPTRDIYDTEVMNAYANALRETAGRREQIFNFYSDKALDAGLEKQWELCIYYVDKALETGFYNADLYFVRGLANEQLGKYKDAKKDYKTSKKLGSVHAAKALESLKEKMKRK
jgi:hypothetical protein